MKSTNETSKSLMNIGKVSSETGCNTETIRYYEKIGLMPRPQRTTGGFRLYDSSHLKRLNFIRRARRLGFSLNEIKDLLSLVDSHSFTCAEVRTMTIEHLHEIENRIEDLKKLRNVLAKMSDQCDGGEVPQCPVIDALFK